MYPPDNTILDHLSSSIRPDIDNTRRQICDEFGFATLPRSFHDKWADCAQTTDSTRQDRHYWASSPSCAWAGMTPRGFFLLPMRGG